MTDIATSWDNDNLRGDWSLAPDGTLNAEDDMATAVTLSLLTEGTALPDDVLPDPGSTIKGWWADTFRKYPLGSRLWLLARSKQTETVRRQAEEYSRQSLQWMIDSGAARAVTTEAAWIARGTLELVITINPPTGERRLWKFVMAWSQIGAQA